MWQIKKVYKNVVAELAATTGLKEPIANLIYQRNITTSSAVQKFLNPQLSDLYPSSLLPDIENALERIGAAIKNQERILVWGHEDLDGITSVVALTETIRDLRGDVQYYIPAKHVEKHGLNSGKVKNFNDHRIKLVITVDCGITNFPEVEDLANSGIDTVILEHHEVLDHLPKAKANVDPKRKDSKYPFRSLAAVGVVLKVAMALTEYILQTHPDEFFSVKPDFLSLVALGTIADRVPLQDENRILVKYGLGQLKNRTRPAIKAILEEEGLDPALLTVEQFMGTLLPLFASANGNQGCHYFMSQNYDAIRQWAKELALQREIWRQEAKQALVIAKKHIDMANGLIIVKSEELPLRAMGHCASKLREQYQLPAIIIGKGNDSWIGECRGVDQVNLLDLLKANSQYFIDFGGHKKACGFSIVEKNLEPFIKGAKDYARLNFADQIKLEPILADGILPLSQLTEEFTKLGPFGEGNPSPLLIAPDTTIKRSRNRIIASDNPTLNLQKDSEMVKLANGIFDLLYTYDENLKVTIKQAIAK